MRGPVLAKCPVYPSHAAMSNTHSYSTPDSHWPPAYIVHENHCWEDPNELSNIDHTSKNDGVVVALSKAGEQGWSVVDKCIDSTELREEADSHCSCRPSPGISFEQVEPPQKL